MVSKGGDNILTDILCYETETIVGPGGGGPRLLTPFAWNFFLNYMNIPPPPYFQGIPGTTPFENLWIHAWRLCKLVSVIRELLQKMGWHNQSSLQIYLNEEKITYICTPTIINFYPRLLLL